MLKILDTEFWTMSSFSILEVGNYYLECLRSSYFEFGARQSKELQKPGTIWCWILWLHPLTLKWYTVKILCSCHHRLPKVQMKRMYFIYQRSTNQNKMRSTRMSNQSNKYRDPPSSLSSQKMFHILYLLVKTHGKGCTFFVQYIFYTRRRLLYQPTNVSASRSGSLKRFAGAKDFWSKQVLRVCPL